MTEDTIGVALCDICCEVAIYYLDISQILLCKECRNRVEDRVIGKIMSLTDDEILSMPSDEVIE